MIEEATEFDKIQANMRDNFIPMLFKAADDINFEYKTIRNDELTIIEFSSEKSGNTFHLIRGLKDEIGCHYFRFSVVFALIMKNLTFMNY
jgi:hypothetical protein